MVMVMLSITTTNMVAAQSKFSVSTVPLSVLDAGNADDKIVNEAGMTGKQVRQLLDAWCNERVSGLTLHKLVTEGEKTTITQAHGNCQAVKGGLQAYFDNTPTGEVWQWNGVALIKDECCNLVASSNGVIQNFLKKHFSQNQGQGSEVVKPRNDQPDQQQQKKENMENIRVLTSGSSEYGPWWAWAIAALFVLGLIALLRPGARDRFIASMRDVWRVEDEFLDRNERRIRRADDQQAERNDHTFRESERQRDRYRGDRPQ